MGKKFIPFPCEAALEERLRALPRGYTQVWYQNKRYLLVCEDFNQGRSLKLWAEEMGGKDYLSSNVYFTRRGLLLKPCEMPAPKVLRFLYHCHWEAG